MSNATPLADRSARELVRAYRAREVSPVEVARAALQRIEAHDGAVNAVCRVDEAMALEEARRSEARYADSMPLGLLDGVPVGIKDIFLTRGQPNLKGSKVIDPAGPWEQDAPAVAALRRHGFVPVCRTTTPEFGWKGVTDSPLTGVTGNPWDPALTAGGSSGGSAAAVALGMCAVALGTDAGGSIRIPAGFCGLVGHKPTHGLAPMWPPSVFGALAHVGPMTRTVADAARMMQVLCEPDARDATLPPCGVDFERALEGGVRGLRIAFSPNFGHVEVEPQIGRAVAEAVALLEALGAEVEQADPGFADPLEAFERLFYGGAANALRDLGAEQRALMDPALVEVVEWAERLSALDYLAATNERAALTERMARFHQRYDLLVTPTLPLSAFEAGRDVPEGWSGRQWPTWTPFSYPFNLTGQPALSVPCGFTDAGLPIGLQIVGPRHRDDLVLRAGHTYQLARPLADRRPKLLQQGDGKEQ